MTLRYPRWLNKRPDAPSQYGQAILDILEKNNTDAWEREFKVSRILM